MEVAKKDMNLIIKQNCKCKQMMNSPVCCIIIDVFIRSLVSFWPKNRVRISVIEKVTIFSTRKWEILITFVVALHYEFIDLLISNRRLNFSAFFFLPEMLNVR